MNRKLLDLVLVCGITIMCMVATLVELPLPGVRLLAGVPLALLLPGYAFSAAFLPSVLNGAERLTLSVGISIGLSVISGLLLNLTPWGIRPDTLALLLGGMTLVAAVIADYRRRESTPGAASLNLRVSLRQAVLFGLAAGLVVGAFNITRISAAAQQTPRFTQLWLLPGDDTQAVRIGVRNLESTAVSYRLELFGATPIQEWPALELAPGQTWETTVELPQGAGEAGTVEGVLYRNDAPTTMYRRVELWVSR